MRDAIVIGGGPSGASLSVLLSRAGRDVALVEREAGPTEKVCGEFLSPEAVLDLSSLGIDLTALGAAPIDAVRLIVGSRLATARLPFAAVSLSRRVLDGALLARAAELGVTVRRGATVQGLTKSGGGWAARLGDGTTIEAGAAFLATGKHDLRGYKRPSGVQGDLVAFKMHWRLSPRQTAELTRHVELVLFRGGYAGLQPVEAGRANLCLLVRRQRLSAVGRWDNLLAAIRAESPHLDMRLSEAVPCAARPQTLAAIPYGYVRRGADGVWRLGDQAVVIPSFSGDGMSIALHSGRLAAVTYLGGGDSDVFQRRLARDVGRHVFLATVLSLALVRRPAQLVLGAVARQLPGLMTTIAGHTRVPDAALARAQLPYR
jgi:flavin-dependent dehydrogenase